MKKLPLLSLGIVLAASLAGCTTKEKSAASGTPAEAKPKQEYVRQSQTGSWITKKVPKTQAQTSAGDTEQSQQALADWQRKGNNQADDPTSRAPRRETPARN